MLTKAEEILEALRNTTTLQGAERALAEIEPIYADLESSFQGPQIYVEIQRLRELLVNETEGYKEGVANV
jgi:hypothetical protein